MKDFNYDKAFMAVKAQRYEEGQKAYEAALQIEPTVEAWTGLGICKLFQLLGNQTMEEVIYCFEKARQVEGADKKSIELQLISYSALVIEQATSYCVTIINEIVQLKKDAASASIIAGIAAGVALNSKSLAGTIVSGSVSAASAGVAVGKLGEISDYEIAGQMVINLIDTVNNNITKYLHITLKEQESIAFQNRTTALKEMINKASAKGLQSGKWYNTGWVWVWLILIWPVGLIGLLLRLKNK